MKSTSVSPGAKGGLKLDQSVYGAFFRVERGETPYMSTISKNDKMLIATLAQWYVDNIGALSIKGTFEGQPETGENNKTANRINLGTYVQRFFDEFSVSDVMQALSVNGGQVTNRNEYDEARTKTLLEHKRNMEAAFLSNQEHVAGGSNVMQTRGIFQYGSSTGGTTDPLVPEIARTPATSRLTGVGNSVPLFTEKQLNELLKSICGAFGTRKDLTLFGGANVLNTVDNFTRVDSSTSAVRYNVNIGGKMDTIPLRVKIFDTTFGRLSLVLDYFVKYTEGGSDETGDPNAAVIVPPAMCSVRYLQDLMVVDTDKESAAGRSGYIKSMCAHIVKNPKGIGLIYNT